MLFALIFSIIFGLEITDYLGIPAILASGLAIHFVLENHKTKKLKKLVMPILSILANASNNKDKLREKKP